jgi:chromosome segregation ATPase
MLRTLGVKGRVVDLCQASQKKYETAVMTILGRNIDSIVVDNDKTAISCIEVSLNTCYATLSHIIDSLSELA